MYFELVPDKKRLYFYENQYERLCLALWLHCRRAVLSQRCMLALVLHAHLQCTLLPGKTSSPRASSTWAAPPSTCWTTPSLGGTPMELQAVWAGPFVGAL